MATYKKGVLGSFSGKLGTVVGSSWKGIDYMRSLGRKSSKPPTQKQIDQRVKFDLVTKFLRPISLLIKLGYQSTKGDLTPLNAAVSYHLNNAVQGSSPNFTIDYTKVLFSRGELIGPVGVIANISDSGSINISIEDNSGYGYAEATDEVTLLIYKPLENQFAVLRNVTTRSEGVVVVQMPLSYEPDTLVYIWLCFFSADGTKVSTSVFVPIIDL